MFRVLNPFFVSLREDDPTTYLSVFFFVSLSRVPFFETQLNSDTRISRFDFFSLFLSLFLSLSLLKSLEKEESETTTTTTTTTRFFVGTTTTETTTLFGGGGVFVGGGVLCGD